jgi:hypothetical protein
MAVRWKLCLRHYGGVGWSWRDMAVKVVTRWKREVEETSSEEMAQKVFAGSPQSAPKTQLACMMWWQYLLTCTSRCQYRQEVPSYLLTTPQSQSTPPLPGADGDPASRLACDTRKTSTVQSLYLNISSKLRGGIESLVIVVRWLKALRRT